MTEHIEEALKPCPFCQRPLHRNSRVATDGTPRVNPYAVCRTEGCWGTKMPLVHLDDPLSIAAWNLRAPTITENATVAPVSVRNEREEGEAVATAFVVTDEWLENVMAEDALIAAHNAYRETAGVSHAQRLEHAIVAYMEARALTSPPGETAQVKGLEWKRDARTSTDRADSVIGEYSAWEISGTGVFLPPGKSAGVLFGDTLDAAKAAAQQDFETRIRSALEVQNAL